MPLFGKKKDEPQPNPAADSLNRILMAALGGDAFEAAVRDGFPIEPSFWVNRAANKLPWDEGPAAMDAMQSWSAPLDEEHDVYASMQPMKEPLDAADRGGLSADQLLQLHEAVTTVIRATALSAARWLGRAHPALFEGEEDPDQSGYYLFINEMNKFEQMLNYKQMTGERIPAFDAIGGVCFEMLAVRQRWHEKFISELTS